MGCIDVKTLTCLQILIFSLQITISTSHESHVHTCCSSHPDRESTIKVQLTFNCGFSQQGGLCRSMTQYMHCFYLLLFISPFTLGCAWFTPKGPAAPVLDDVIMASCISTAFCTAQHLSGIVLASELVFKDFLYCTFTPELFWSISSIVDFSYLWACPFVSQHTVANIRTVLFSNSPISTIVAQHHQAHHPLRTLNFEPIPTPISFFYLNSKTTSRTQTYMQWRRTFFTEPHPRATSSGPPPPIPFCSWLTSSTNAPLYIGNGTVSHNP